MVGRYHQLSIAKMLLAAAVTDLQQKEVFDIISTQIKDIVWVMNTDLSYRSVSSSVTGFRGLTQEAALQETVFESVPPQKIETIAGDLTSATAEFLLSNLVQSGTGLNLSPYLSF